MKTRDRILEAARVLFNEEGVAALSAVDIATALGISPGHLYYHFKGKPEIVAVLLEAYEREVATVLAAARDDCKGANATIETLWTHLHILIEEAWDARFFYRETGALAHRQPEAATCIRRVTAAQRAALARLLVALKANGAIVASPEVLDGLSRMLVTGIGFHALELELEGDAGPPRERNARAAAQLMLLVAALAPTA
ncbi:MAG TPA: TetR family transcriptional regulator [Rhizomicrobium sp.]